MRFEIRQASTEDAALITYHRRRMFEDMGRDAVTVADMERRFLPWVEKQLEQQQYLGWLAVSENQVVAGAGLWIMDWPPHILGFSTQRGYILNVYTEPAYRHKGLARQLTQCAVDWCWANQLDVITLHASDEGRPLYESMGFHASNEMRLMRPGR